MPATMTVGNSRPLAACMLISQTRAASGVAVGFVGLRQQRQPIDEPAQRRLVVAHLVFARGRDELHQVLDAGFGLFALSTRAARAGSRIDRARGPG